MILLISLESSAAAQIQGERQFERWFLGGDVNPPRGVPHTKETYQTPALGLEGIHREGCVTAATWMHDMILTASQGPFHPQVPQIECQGRMDANGWMQCI